MRLLIFIISLFFSTLIHAEIKKETKLLPALNTFLYQIKTLKVNFEQQVLDRYDLSIKGISRGELYLSRPNKLRWEYQVPEKQTIIADGRFIWVYNEDLDQASSAFQNMAIKGTPADILINPNHLSKHYQVTQAGENKMIFTPKNKKNKYRWISITFLKNGLLGDIDIEDKLDQRIRFRFYNEQRDLKLDPALFVFTPTDGTDIFEH